MQENVKSKGNWKVLLLLVMATSGFSILKNQFSYATPLTISTTNFSAHLFVNATPTVSFHPNFLGYGTIGEEHAGGSPSVLLSPSSSSTVTVDYTVGPGTATSVMDFIPNTGTLTFAPGETIKRINFRLTDDNIAESDETVLFTLSNPSGATLGSLPQYTL